MKAPRDSILYTLLIIIIIRIISPLSIILYYLVHMQLIALQSNHKAEQNLLHTLASLESASKMYRNVILYIVCSLCFMYHKISNALNMREVRYSIVASNKNKLNNLLSFMMLLSTNSEH